MLPSALTPRVTIPLLTLLHPRNQTPLLVLVGIGGLALGRAAMIWLQWPLWAATLLLLALLLVPGIAKWHEDARRFGRVAMLLSILLATQGFHGVEHLLQWAQYHLLNWDIRLANGLLSPANAEWVHFIWNWLVLVAVVVLIAGSVRNVFAWALLLWALAHTIEHTYMFIRYLQVMQELQQLGISGVSAQGLPGLLGRNGWLAQSQITQGTFLCTLPGVTTAPRLDVHFWWNVGETVLLVCTAHVFMRAHLQQIPHATTSLSTHIVKRK